MAAHGYLVYLLRINKPYRNKVLQRLSSAGDTGDDLLELIGARLEELGHGFYRDDKTSEGFRVKEVARAGRAVYVRFNKGPSGSPGETFDEETQESVETTERQALLSGLRAFLVVPKDSYYGLLFVEKVGRRHLKEVLTEVAIKPAAQRAGVVMRIESFAELKDWEAELGQKQVLVVSELLVPTSSGEDASTPDDSTVTVTATGGRVRGVTDRLQGILSKRLTGREKRLDDLATASGLERKRVAEPDAFTVQNAQELAAATQRVVDAEKAPAPAVDPELKAALDGLVPADREGLAHKRYEVSVGERRVERTFVIESDAVPQFTYQLGGRLEDDALVKVWKQHALGILKNRRVQLPADWDKDPAPAKKPQG